MDKFMEFLKNNTAVVAVAAGIVLFIAMNGITSCVAKGGGNDAPADAQEQLEQKSEQPSHKGDAADSKTELTERQRSAIRDYDQPPSKSSSRSRIRNGRQMTAAVR